MCQLPAPFWLLCGFCCFELFSSLYQKAVSSFLLSVLDSSRPMVIPCFVSSFIGFRFSFYFRYFKIQSFFFLLSSVVTIFGVVLALFSVIFRPGLVLIVVLTFGAPSFRNWALFGQVLEAASIAERSRELYSNIPYRVSSCECLGIIYPNPWQLLKPSLRNGEIIKPSFRPRMCWVARALRQPSFRNGFHCGHLCCGELLFHVGHTPQTKSLLL